MHAEMLYRLLCATMPCFSKTRAGSILQRFSRDLWDVSDCNASVLNLSHRLVYGEPQHVLVTLHLSLDKAVCISLVTVAIYGACRLIPRLDGTSPLCVKCAASKR